MIESLTHYFSDTTAGTVEAIWSGSSEPIRVIFDNAYFDVLGVSSRQPRIIAMESSMPGLMVSRQIQQLITVSGQAYSIEGIESDGHGVVTLRLEKNVV
jgi:hypothetical protein